MDSIIVKYSQSPGVEPVPNQLLTGEPVMNTYDGRLFMKKSNVEGDSIVSFVNFYDLPSATVLSASFSSTASFVTPLRQNVFITGSLNISGSTLQVGNNTLFGSTLLSGSVTISGSYPVGSYSSSVNIYGDTSMTGYLKFNPQSTNIDTSASASYIFVSGSTQDLYFSQNSKGYNNVTRLRWLEGNLYTGLLSGGLISITAGSTTFNISSGSGLIVTLNASVDQEPFPTIKYVKWESKLAQPLPYLTSSIQTFVGIDSDGNILQQTSPWNDGQYNTSISIGTVLHQNKSTVNASITYPNVAYGYKQRTYDFIKAFGPLKLSGFTLVPSGSLGLGIGSGTAFAEGRNYQVDPNNPSYISDPGTAVSKIFRYYQSGSEFVQDTSGSLGYTEIDPARYNLNGTLTPVPGVGSNREWSIKRVFWYPNSATKGIVVYYGNAVYPSSTDAIAGLPYETFVETPNTQQNAIYVGAIAIRNNGSFTDSGSFAILPGGVFRNVGGSGGGGSLPTVRLRDLSDVDVIGSADHQPLAYNTDLGKWTNQSNISSSISGNAETATTASYARTASFVVNAISSSYSSLSQNSNTASFVTTAQTASFVTTAQTASYVVTALTASFVTTAQTASFVLTARTASFVTTAQTASYVLQAVSSSFSSLAATASFVATASNAISSSYSVTASYVLGQTATSSYAISSSQAVTASFLLGQSATSSYALSSSNAISASYAITASFVLGQTATSSYALSASNANSASLATTASYALTAPYSGLVGTVPTWNQSTTGTAANITATSNTTLTSIANLATVGTITSGIWNGSAIGDTYISSATNWNTAYNRSATSLTFSAATFTLTKQDGTTLTAAVPTFNQNTTGQAGSVANAVTFTNSGGATAGTTYNGSVARTIDYSTLGAQALSTNLTSLSGLSYASTSFVKMTGANTFALDVNTYYSSSNPSGYTTNTGTVTTVSVASANGFAGTVANAGTTPAITVSTSITGLLKGNGTAISAASAGTDYQAALTGTGLVKSTAGTISYDTSTYYSSSNPSGYTSNAGTVTTVSVATANGVSGTVANAGTTPAITLTLGAITPSTVNGLTLAAAGSGFTIAGGTTSKTLTVSNTLTLAGTDSSTLNIGSGGTLGSAAFTAASAYQAALSGTGFVKISGTTISYDNSTYLTTAVTSVGGTGTVSGLTLSGTVTTTGNLTLGGTLSVIGSNFGSQTANTFLAAPNGSAGNPTFRAIVAADIPTLNQNTTGTAGSISGFNNPVTTGSPNTIAYRDGSGDLYARYFTGSYVTTSDDINAGTITHIMAKFGDNFHRSATAAKVASFISGQTMNIVGSASTITGTYSGTLTSGQVTTALGFTPGTGNGSVTSVAGTGTVSGISLSGTVTTTGNLTLGGTLAVTPSNFASQTANTFLAAPNGSAGVPTFRAIAAADVPTLNQSTTGNASTATTATNQSGGTINATTGTITPNTSGVSTGLTVVNGDITTYRTGGTTGVIYLSSSGTKYVYWNGSNYEMPGGPLYVNSNPVWTEGTLTNLNQLTNGPGYTSNTGTVTSVGGTGTVSGLSLSGTVTTSGNLTLGGTLAVTAGNFSSQTANTFLCAPNGSAGTPTFRAIVAADIPTLNQNTTGTAATITGVYSGTITSSQITTGLGFTPYSNTNPSGYTSNTGTVTSVGGTGTVSGLTLSGTVTTSGNLTLGGTLSLTSGNVTTALGYTPYNSTNPSGYITSGASISGNAASVTYLPNRTDGTAYQVLWGAAYTNSIGTIAYSCANVTITSSTGTLTASGLTETSSKRYKENIVPLENSLDKIIKLRGVKYNKIGNDFQEIGVIAEEVEEVVPEFVVYNEEGQADSVNYGRMTALLLEGMKEQQLQIKEQQLQIEQLKAEIELLKQK